MIKIYIMLISILMLFTYTTMASSPDAWISHYEEVEATCLKSSGLREAKSIGDIIGFGDDIGYDALVISGRYPQPHMKNAKSTVLCLFNRSTRVATISEAQGLRCRAE